MTEKKTKTPNNNRQKILLENPYDIETFFEGLSISSKNEKELIFMDRVIAGIRLDPEIEMAKLIYDVLNKMELLKLEKDNK